MAEPTTRTLDVPGAVLHYGIRTSESTTEPPLLLFGSPLPASGLVTLASHFTDRTAARRARTAALTEPSDACCTTATVAFSPDGQILAAGDGNGTAYLWDVATRSVIETPTVPGTGKRYIESLAFSPDGRTLAVADYDGRASTCGMSPREILTRP